MPKPNRLTDRIWDMEPESVILFTEATPREATLRTTVSRIAKADPAREYGVKKTREGVVVVRVA